MILWIREAIVVIPVSYTHLDVYKRQVLVATEKPFAKIAVDGIRKEIEAAGYELVLLEKYTYKSQLLLSLIHI